MCGQGGIEVHRVIGNLVPASDLEIERLLVNPAEITRFLFGADAEQRERLCLDKTWHAIHFALVGSRLGGERALNFLVSEGRPVGDVNVGFGPARVVSSQLVHELAALLALIEPHEFGERIDVRRLDEADIYPGHWQRDGLSLDCIVANYRAMRDLIQRLAGESLGMILYVN